MDADIAAQLNEALKTNRTLTGLELGHSRIGDVGAESLKLNLALAALHLNDTQMGGIVAGLLPQALDFNTTLTTLRLDSNKIPLRDQSPAAAIEEKLKRNQQAKNRTQQTTRVALAVAAGADTVMPVKPDAGQSRGRRVAVVFAVAVAFQRPV